MQLFTSYKSSFPYSPYSCILKKKMCNVPISSHCLMRDFERLINVSSIKTVFGPGMGKG